MYIKTQIVFDCTSTQWFSVWWEVILPTLLPLRGFNSFWRHWSSESEDVCYWYLVHKGLGCYQ